MFVAVFLHFLISKQSRLETESTNDFKGGIMIIILPDSVVRSNFKP